MAKVTYWKEPGFTYDLLAIFMLYHNPESGIKTAAIEEHFEEEKAYFQSVLAPFLPMSDDLLLFFYLKDNNRFFMSEKYFDLQSKMFGTEKYRLQNILNELSDYDKVKWNMLHFYFRDVPESELEAGTENLAEISKWIKGSAYPEKIKNALYEFFIEPIPLIQKLIQELLVKEVVLEQQYQKEYQKLLKVQNEFDYEWIAEKLLNEVNNVIDIRGYENVVISGCVLYKNICYYRMCDDRLILMLGWDYKNAFCDFGYRVKLVELEKFGNAVSEKNRVEILNLMVEKGKVTIKDLERELGLTATNAYYHLMLMQKTGMLQCGNVGRTMFYGLDKGYFENLEKTIEKYTK